MAPHGAQPRPEENKQDSGREGRGGAARGPVKLGPPAPRVSAHGRAALLPPPPPPPALRPSPPPAARRSLHYPARRPPSFVATTSAGRGARAGALRHPARVSGSAVRPSLRALMDVVWGCRGCKGLRAGPTAPLGISGWCLPAFYTPAGARGGSTPVLVSSRTFSRGGHETETGTAIALSRVAWAISAQP